MFARARASEFPPDSTSAFLNAEVKSSAEVERALYPLSIFAGEKTRSADRPTRLCRPLCRLFARPAGRIAVNVSPKLAACEFKSRRAISRDTLSAGELSRMKHCRRVYIMGETTKPQYFPARRTPGSRIENVTPHEEIQKRPADLIFLSS